MIKPMLCQDGTIEHLMKPGMFMQEKFDGTRCIATKKGDAITLIGRSQKNDYGSRFPEIVNDLRKIPHDFILDGEITFFKNGKPVFQTALATPETKAQYQVRYMVFDIVRRNKDDLKRNSVFERLSAMYALVPKNLKHVSVVETYHKPTHNFTKIYETIIQNGGEGVVLKEANSPYIEESRAHWYKVKQINTEDCVVLGITKGKGAREATFGALILGQYQGGKLRLVGKSSGFDVATGNRLYHDVMSLSETANPTETKVADVIRWINPLIVVEVTYMQRTPYGMLRHPRFMRVRTDKNPKSCVMRG